MTRKSKDKRPENAETPPANTGYPQPTNAGYPQPANTGYLQPANTGYPQPANTGYPQPANAGYPQPASTGYPQPANTGYPQPANVGTYPANTGGGLPISISQLGPQPITVICRSCNQQILTRIEVKPSTKTHLIALIICLVFWPCVFLPYCIPYCQNADHYCPNCNAYIGTHSN